MAASGQTVYQDNIGQWTAQKADSKSKDTVTSNSIKICTWNIWFGNERQELRMHHILKIIQSHNVDIFCFQEVTQQLLQYLLSDPFVRRYHLSGITQKDTGAYGNVIFSRWPLSAVYLKDYTDTGMGRKLVAVDVPINGQLLRIGTVHLESLPPGRRKRVVQLQESLDFLLKKQNADDRPNHLMIMGDFNCCATNDVKSLPMTDDQFIDSWITHHGGNGNYESQNPGWTMPENDYFPPWRPDRLYFAFNYDYTKLDEAQKAKEARTGSLDSDDEEEEDQKENNLITNNTQNESSVLKEDKEDWCLKYVQRVGMEDIPNEEEEEEEEDGDDQVDDAKGLSSNTNKKSVNAVTIFTPSDHYGIVAEFEWNGSSMTELNPQVRTTDDIQEEEGDNCGCVIM